MSVRTQLAAICVVAALLRLGAFLYLDRVHHPDVWESETIALNVMAGHGYVFESLGTPYRSYMEPLYPALCIAVYSIAGHSFVALGLVQIALGTLVVWLVYACGRRIVPEQAAVFAALIAAVHPGLILYTTKFHPFILDVPLWLTSFLLVLAFSPARPWRSAALAGLAIGVSVLTRPTILVCLPMVGWWFWERSGRRLSAAAARLAVTTAVVAAVVAPWTIRNYTIQHRFMLTRSGTAFVFWLGNNPYLFTGSAKAPDGGDLVTHVPAPVLHRLLSLDELGQQDYFQREAAAYVRADPAGFVERTAVKFWYFWWFSPQAGGTYPAPWLRGYKIFYLVVAGLAAAGIAGGWRARTTAPIRWAGALFLLGCCLSIAAVQSVYYVEGRHRLAIEPLLAVFAGGGAWQLLRRQERERAEPT